MKLLVILIFLALLCCSETITLNWKQLKRALANKRYTQISRSPQKEKKYSTLRESLKERNITMYQHVKWNILGFQGHPQNPIYLLKKVSVDDKKLSVYVTGERSTWRKFIKKSTQYSRVSGVRKGSNFALLAVNNFPYDLYEVNHWVVWTNYRFPHETQKAVISQILNENVESLMYENPPSMKSVPEINHFQLFWKKKNDIQ